LRDPEKTHSCKYNPDALAEPGHLGFLFRTLMKASFQRAPNKNPSACGTGIVFDVGHTESILMNKNNITNCITEYKNMHKI
jgi:hypothetical protein